MYSRSVFTLSTGLMVVLCIIMNQQQVTSQPIDQQDLVGSASNDELLLSSEHLKGVECGPDEYLAPGKVKSCEPTCQNPKADCLRMFYASLDYYPCFCKAPLVRETESNKCVPITDCP